MIKSNVILLLFAVLCFTSCEKQKPETTTEPTPIASFYASTTNANVGDNISFTNNSKDADHCVWNFGDGSTPSTESNPCHAYASKGVYNVVLTVYSPSEEKHDEMPMSITVTEATPEEPKPTALFSASTTNANVGDNICFTNKSMNADHYVWDFGDGQTSQESNPCHTYASKGAYYVKLTAYSPTNGKHDETGMIINVTEATPEEPKPTALFNASITNASVDDVICFTNKSMNAHHYEWDFGDGQTSTEPNPCHAYSSKGVYYVQLTAYSPTGEMCDVTGMNINVEEATGSIMFWMNSPGYIVTVELDGIKKEINGYYPNYNPECGDEGCATFNDLPVGEHYYRAESYDGWWSDYITIEKGVCKRMLLLKGKATPFKDGDMPEVDKRMAERIE